MTTKGTPLTMEVFEEKIMPQFERIMEEYRGELVEFKAEVNNRFEEVNSRFEEVNSRFEEADKTIRGYKNDVIDMKVEVLTEIQRLRDEVTVALHQYKRTNRRVDLIDRHLGISTADLD